MKNFKETASFIWSIADLLRGDYKQSDYGKVILPLTILRRLDCVLEKTKVEVLKSYEKVKTTINWMYYIVFNQRFTIHFESLIDNTGQQPNISLIDIENIPIPLPPKTEQSEIIEYLLTEGNRIKSGIAVIQQEIQLLKEYKTALISEVVTGKVDVREEVIIKPGAMV